jgi:hypothetical protein
VSLITKNNGKKYKNLQGMQGLGMESPPLSCK